MSETRNTRFRLSSKTADKIAELSAATNMSVDTAIRLSLIGASPGRQGAEAQRLLAGSMLYPDKIASALLDCGVKSKVSAVRLDDVEHPYIDLLMSDDQARDVLMAFPWKISSATEFVAVFFLGKFISLFRVELQGQAPIVSASQVDVDSDGDGKAIFDVLNGIDGLAVRDNGYKGKVLRLCN